MSFFFYKLYIYVSSEFCMADTGHKWAKSVPVSDQKGAKTRHRAAHTYMAVHKEVSPSRYSTLDRNPSDSARINFG